MSFKATKRHRHDEPQSLGLSSSKRPFIEEKHSAIPTAAELAFIRETPMLYHSTDFRTQMDEMMKNIGMTLKQRVQLDLWLKTFTKFLKAIPAATQPIQLDDSSSYTAVGVQIPLQLPQGCEGKFQFAPPTNVAFTGSFATRTITSQNPVIDLMVEVPQSCIEKHDNRNGRWLLKRAHYLAHLAGALAACDKVHGDQLSWALHMGEPLRPVLVVKPRVSGCTKWSVQLLPVPAPGSFAVHAFAPNKVNIKHKVVTSCQRLNFLCCVDLVMAATGAELQEVLSTMEGVKQGVILTKVWLDQRQLYSGRGGFSGHLVTMLVLYLYRAQKVRSEMSGFQVFKIILHYLESECQWTESGLNLYEAFKKSEDSTNPLAGTILSTARYHELYPVVFVDHTGYINLTTGLTSHVLTHVVQEAQHCLPLTASNVHDCFEILFIRRTSFNLAFDQSVLFTVNNEALRQYYSPAKAESLVLLLNQLHPDVYGSAANDSVYGEGETWPVGELEPMIPQLTDVLKRGLQQRATLVVHRLNPLQTWDVAEPKPSTKKSLLFGLKLNPDFAFNLLTKDTTDQPIEFREFWGDELSGLRRFRNGTACETVTWGDGTEGAGDTRTIPGQIIKTLLHRHFSINSSKFLHIGPNVERLLRLPESAPDSKAYSTGESMCMAAEQAYDALSRVIRELQLDLPVTSVVSSSPYLAHAQVFPRRHLDQNATLANQLKLLSEVTDPIEVLVFLERSGKWPEELEAVNFVRHGFHQVIKKQLARKRIPVLTTVQHLRVAMQGFAFTVRVTYQGEVLMLRQLNSATTRRQLWNEEDLSEVDTPESLALQIQTTVTPKIVSALAGLRRQYGSYSACVRLCRRYLRSQLLEPHWPPLLTQLLVAHLFMTPEQFQAPHTPYVGFIRFLNLLATTNWELKPFFVNLADEFQHEDLLELKSRFKNKRALLPTVFVATPFDIRGGNAKLKDFGGLQNMDEDSLNFRYKLVSQWSRVNPLPQLVMAVQQHAVHTLERYSANILKPAFDCAQLFHPQTTYYDIIAHLKPAVVARLEENVRYGTEGVKPVHCSSGRKGKQTARCDGNLVSRTVQRLRKKYEGKALVFYDEDGGDVIGLTFKPEALQEKNLSETYEENFLSWAELLSTQHLMGQLRLPLIADHLQAGELKHLARSVTAKDTVS